jgi:hypothetical protein
MKIGNGTSTWDVLPYFPPDTATSSVFDGGTPTSTYGTLPAFIDCGGVV